MSETHTIKLHRVFKCPAERLYRAFIDADAMAKWLPPHGFVCNCQEMNATVGGRFKMSFRNFATGHVESFGGEFKELVPNERIRYTDKFDDPNLAGEISVLIELKGCAVGTELNIAQAGIPAVIPAEACYLGWQQSLSLLALLVEAEIPDQ